jgi:N-acylglucosamine 2-epimerase
MTGKTSLMSPKRIDALIATYRDGLLRDTLPFWISHAVDREYGGFLSCLDRDGTVIDTDKSVWIHGRFIWLLSTVYNKVEPRPEWLALARHGIDFLRRYAFDSDGRMFFHLTRDGRPLRKRRYIFAETFAVAGLAAYASAAGDAEARDQAVSLFELVTHYLTTPGLLPPKVNPETRAMKGLAVPMIMIVTAQILREAAPDLALCDQWIDRSISEIENHFMKPEFEAVLETVGPNGEFLDHFDGRMLCPATPSRRPGLSCRKPNTAARPASRGPDRATPGWSSSARRSWIGCGCGAGTRSTAASSTIGTSRGCRSRSIGRT